MANEKWKVVFNAPLAAIPGHLIKVDNEVESPVALLWEGGGTHGKQIQIDRARLIAAAPELLEALKEISDLQFPTIWRGHMDKARAAIKKAETGE